MSPKPTKANTFVPSSKPRIVVYIDPKIKADFERLAKIRNRSASNLFETLAAKEIEEAKANGELIDQEEWICLLLPLKFFYFLLQFQGALTRNHFSPLLFLQGFQYFLVDWVNCLLREINTLISKQGVI